MSSMIPGLTIGNYVECEVYGIIKVEKIVFDVIHTTVSWKGSSKRKMISKKYKPIPLDDEWKKKFKFIRIHPERKSHFVLIDKIVIEIYHDNSIMLSNDEETWSRGECFDPPEKLEYVHQLQNLYELLTKTTIEEYE